MKKQAGFTLIELMIAMAVAAILLALAVPSLRSFIQNSKAVTQTNQLVTALNYSRSEAVKRRTRVMMCAFNASQNDCASINIPWDDNGWMVFADRDNDGVYDADDGDDVLETGEDVLLKQWKEIKTKDDINVTSGSVSLSYLQTGALSSTAALGLLVSVDDSSDVNRCVRVQNTGRVEYEKMESGVTCP